LDETAVVPCKQSDTVLLSKPTLQLTGLVSTEMGDRVLGSSPELDTCPSMYLTC